MKTKMSNYRNCFALACVLLVAVLFVGCDKEKKFEKTKSIYPVIGELTAVEGNGKREIRLYVIDGCEYIGCVNIFYSDLLTHKGNCKFCLARHAK